ncbi:MAG: hypothetical protein RPR97_12310 [Colwellia sp.]
MEDNFFKLINTDALVSLIDRAESSLCYAAPGIQLMPAKALVELARRISPAHILVFLDVDENVLRMGYGEIESINLLKQAGIQVQHLSGLRNGLIVSDCLGYSYTPTALFLEKETTDTEALNGMRLMPGQVKETLARLSPASKSIALAQAETPEEKARINSFVSEKQPTRIDEESLKEINQNIHSLPPVKFDVARQVRVFQPHFQYVELSLTGAAIQRHKLKIPKVIQDIGADNELDGRLNTTFDLIDKGASVSSSVLDKDLRDIRDKLTKSLGKKHGRIIRKVALPRLEKRLSELRVKIEDHQESIKDNLDEVLESSKTLVVDYYLPLVSKNPPDDLYGIFGEPDAEDIRSWLNAQLSKEFPTADDFLNKIQLDVHYKDVTFTTLNQANFLDQIKAAYPDVNWDKTYYEYKAAGEQASESL